MKFTKYSFIFLSLTNLINSFCHTVIYMPQNIVKRNDPNRDLRNLLYKMENDLLSIEDIKKNKIFYTVILENHMRHLSNKQNNLNNARNVFLTPAFAVCLSLSLTTSLIALDEFIRNKFTQNACEMSANATAFGLFAILSYLGIENNINSLKYIQSKIERDQRLIKKLRQL